MRCSSQGRRGFIVCRRRGQAFKLPIQYSHIEAAQYEKLMNLLNVFSEQVAARTAKKGKKWRGSCLESV
jgi:hypothetical protein